MKYFKVDNCSLCLQAGESVLWQDTDCRVINAPQPGYPGLCRVIWNEHAREMTDLSQDQRARLMVVVWAMEEALRQVLKPAKINLASLGNQVPHLHWHVIPRFEDDPHFPDAIWTAPHRSGVEHHLDLNALAEALQQRLNHYFN